MRTFETLDVWKKARNFRNEMSLLTKSFPDEETYKLRDQLLRSSRAVTANLAEGYGRFHYQENLQFCRQARGSLFETLDHLSVSLDEGYITEDDFEQFRDTIMEVNGLLNGYINYIQDQKEQSDE